MWGAFYGRYRPKGTNLASTCITEDRGRRYAGVANTKNWQRGFLGSLLVAGGALGFALFGPGPIDPVAWVAPPDEGFTGAFFPIPSAATLQFMCMDRCPGPETTAHDGKRVFTGHADGSIAVTELSTGASQTVASTGGRPLGLALDAQHRLIVADSTRGLLSVNIETGDVGVLVRDFNGSPFKFVDDVDIGPSGIIYFSDASAKFGLADSTLIIMEQSGDGRVLAYDPKSTQTRVVAEGLFFPNGVAVSKDENFLLVCETARYRVMKIWIGGPRAGQREVFVDNLPGFPDGISRGESGLFWIAIHSPRSPILDGLAGFPRVRKMLQRIPERLLPLPPRHGLAVAVDASGKVRHVFHQEGPSAYAPITSVEEAGDALLIGSLERTGFGRIAWQRGEDEGEHSAP